MLKKVVLPAPFGPISETIEPCGIVKLTSFVAIRPPNSLRTSSATSRSVILAVPVCHGAFRRYVVERGVADAQLQLSAMPALRNQTFESKQHHQDDDHAVD